MLVTMEVKIVEGKSLSYFYPSSLHFLYQQQQQQQPRITFVVGWSYLFCLFRFSFIFEIESFLVVDPSLEGILQASPREIVSKTCFRSPTSVHWKVRITGGIFFDYDYDDYDYDCCDRDKFYRHFVHNNYCRRYVLYFNHDILHIFFAKTKTKYYCYYV